MNPTEISVNDSLIVQTLGRLHYTILLLESELADLRAKLAMKSEDTPA